MFTLLRPGPQPPEPEIFDHYDVEVAGGFDYLALASRCATQNSFNRLHIDLEDICTPLELARVAKLARRWRFPKQGRRWLRKLRRLSPELFVAPRPFERSAFGRRIFLYRDPRFEPGDRNLLIAFTGNARRLMSPISVFLQFVDPAVWDVVLLMKKFESAYWEGLDVAADFPGLIEHIETTFKPARYRRMMTLGTSAGGLSAIWAALLLKAERGISVGGLPPNPLPPGLVRGSAAPRGPDLCYVHGRDFDRDHNSALALQNLFGGRLFAVPDVDAHNVFEALLRRRGFAEFVDRILA